MFDMMRIYFEKRPSASIYHVPHLEQFPKRSVHPKLGYKDTKLSLGDDDDLAAHSEQISIGQPMRFSYILGFTRLLNPPRSSYWMTFGFAV